MVSTYIETPTVMLTEFETLSTTSIKISIVTEIETSTTVSTVKWTGSETSTTISTEIEE